METADEKSPSSILTVSDPMNVSRAQDPVIYYTRRDVRTCNLGVGFVATSVYGRALADVT